jgi:hypothetical protein
MNFQSSNPFMVSYTFDMRSFNSDSITTEPSLLALFLVSFLSSLGGYCSSVEVWRSSTDGNSGSLGLVHSGVGERVALVLSVSKMGAPVWHVGHSSSQTYDVCSSCAVSEANVTVKSWGWFVMCA